MRRADLLDATSPSRDGGDRRFRDGRRHPPARAGRARRRCVSGLRRLPARPSPSPSASTGSCSTRWSTSSARPASASAAPGCRPTPCSSRAQPGPRQRRRAVDEAGQRPRREPLRRRGRRRVLLRARGAPHRHQPAGPAGAHRPAARLHHPRRRRATSSPRSRPTRSTSTGARSPSPPRSPRSSTTSAGPRPRSTAPPTRTASRTSWTSRSSAPSPAASRAGGASSPRRWWSSRWSMPRPVRADHDAVRRRLPRGPGGRRVDLASRVPSSVRRGVPDSLAACTSRTVASRSWRPAAARRRSPSTGWPSSCARSSTSTPSSRPRSSGWPPGWPGSTTTRTDAVSDPPTVHPECRVPRGRRRPAGRGRRLPRRLPRGGRRRPQGPGLGLPGRRAHRPPRPRAHGIQPRRARRHHRRPAGALAGRVRPALARPVARSGSSSRSGATTPPPA